MFKVKWFVVLVLFLIAVQPSFADDSAKIIGTWRIVSYEWETQATGEREPIMGKNPTGYIIFTPEGRTMTIITGEGRKAPNTDQDRADLLKSMVAHTGMYRLEGDKCISTVDVAWAPDRLGTEQIFFFRFDGDRLQVISAWMQPGTRPERGMGRNIITWERAR